MADDVDRLAEEIVERLSDKVTQRLRAQGFRVVEGRGFDGQRSGDTAAVASILRARLPSSGDQVSLPASELAALREAKAALDALEALVEHADVLLQRQGDDTMREYLLSTSDNMKDVSRDAEDEFTGPTLASALSAAALAAKGAR